MSHQVHLLLILWYPRPLWHIPISCNADTSPHYLHPTLEWSEGPLFHPWSKAQWVPLHQHMGWNYSHIEHVLLQSHSLSSEFAHCQAMPVYHGLHGTVLVSLLYWLSPSSLLMVHCIGVASCTHMELKDFISSVANLQHVLIFHMVISDSFSLSGSIFF